MKYNGNKSIYRLISVIIMVVVCGQTRAVTVLDSLLNELKHMDNAADSVGVLFDIYDCSSYQERGTPLEKLYETAVRAGDEYSALEALHLLAGLYEGDDKEQARLLERVKKLPDSDARRRTELYIKVRHAFTSVRSLPEEERVALIRDQLARYKETRNLHTYDRIEYLFYLCGYIRSTTDGEFLIRYLRELETLIEELPEEELYLRSIYYKQAAMCYLANNMLRDAVEANRKALEINNLFDKRHGDDGREFRYYTGSTYLYYHNILMCHEVLTPEEIEDCYSHMLALEQSTARLQDSPALIENSRIYYLMAIKQYDQAVPLIKKQLEINNSREEYSYMVDALIKISTELRDKKDLLLALRLNNELLNERLETKTDQSLKELQILYEVNDLRRENNNLEHENLNIDTKYRREQMTKAIIAIVIVLVLLIMALVLYRRNRRLADNLKKSNITLTNERDILRNARNDLIVARDQAKAADKFKNDFVNNMNREISTPLSAIVEYSHLLSDYALSDKREYIRHYGTLLSRNCDLLITLVNDVLELPSLESARLSVNIQSASAQSICRMAVDLIRNHLAPGVELVYESDDDPDVSVRTDPNRVEQVLIHMLSNAAKFTEKGFVTLSYSLSHDRSKLSFTVTDTGIGIPRGKEEVIFSRFEKISHSTQGNGLGLYICRLLADMLKGEIRLDATYRKGARFIFTIPVEY